MATLTSLIKSQLRANSLFFKTTIMKEVFWKEHNDAQLSLFLREMSLTCYQKRSMSKPCEAGKGLLEYNSAISPFGILFTFFHNALAGRPTEKLIMRLKKELLV